MIRKNKNGIHWLEFEILQKFPNVVHGVFLKADTESGSESVEKLQSILVVTSVISATQVHGNEVKDINGLLETDSCDGLTTTKKQTALSIRHADCQAAIFYDPKKQVIANIHCGWKGSVQNIYAKTVEMMKKNYGSNPQDLIVCISPSLGPERSEFLNFEQEFPFDLWPFQLRPFYIDFWEISKNQLEEAGVLSKHIEVAGICTYDHPNDFFSYRRDKTTKRNQTLVALK